MKKENINNDGDCEDCYTTDNREVRLFEFGDFTSNAWTHEKVLIKKMGISRRRRGQVRVSLDMMK